MRFRVVNLNARSLTFGDRIISVVLVKLVAVDQVAGDMLIAVTDPVPTFHPGEVIMNHAQGTFKTMIAPETMILSVAGKVGGVDVTLALDAEYTISFQPVAMPA